MIQNMINAAPPQTLGSAIEVDRDFQMAGIAEEYAQTMVNL